MKPIYDLLDRADPGFGAVDHFIQRYLNRVLVANVLATGARTVFLYMGVWQEFEDAFHVVTPNRRAVVSVMGRRAPNLYSPISPNAAKIDATTHRVIDIEVILP